MNILMVTPMPPATQASGAIPLVLHAQLTALAAQHRVTLLTMVGTDPAELEAIHDLREAGFDVRAVRRREREKEFEAWKRRWRLASMWAINQNPWRTAWFYEPDMQHMLDCLLAGGSFDLVTAEDDSLGVYTYRTSAPTLLTENEVRRPRPVNWLGWRGKNPLHWALSEADWKHWDGYQRAIWSRFDRVQVYTPRDADVIRTMAPQLAKRVRVNPFGIDLPHQVDASREENDNILFVGNMTHAPNVDAALWLGHEIMPLLRTQRPGVRLTIAGPQPPKPVQVLASEDVLVTGFVPEIEPFMDRAAVVVAPVRMGGGQRLKVLQSMARAKAVVTTPRGADGLAIDGRKPPLAIAEDAEAIAATIERLLSSSIERHQLGDLARAFVIAHYSPPAYAERLEAIYSEFQPTGIETL